MATITERISQTYNIPEEYLTETPPVPRSVKIEVTSRCDFKCFFCEHTFRDDEHADIDQELLYRMLREMAEAGVREVGLFWIGESMLVKALPKYVAYAKSLGFGNVYLTTNGRLATPKRIDALLKAGLDSIKFSVSGSNRQNYITVTGVDAFDKVLANMNTFMTRVAPLASPEYSQVRISMSPILTNTRQSTNSYHRMWMSTIRSGYTEAGKSPTTRAQRRLSACPTSNVDVCRRCCPAGRYLRCPKSIKMDK